MNSDTGSAGGESGRPAPPAPPETGFRDRIGTIDEKGKRRWIYPKKPRGRYYRARTWVSLVLLGFLFGSPFVKIGGEQLLLFNILDRKFVIFGMIFWPQDFYLFGLAMIAAVVFIFLFTVLFGRLFCGWICPQTVFMEMVFRKIEYLIEGDAHDQRLLNSRPWTPLKLFKKTAKHGIFYLLSFVISNFFLAYIIGMDALLTIVTDPPAAHLGGLFAILLFSGVFYFVFAWFREQACVLVCPYGRLQSVLLDENSVVISYDFSRGEPRERFRKNQPREHAGDCVDCKQCVVVCPTGIDIRNGTQLECVNCTACIDACDDVMTRVGLPTGLIRYASHNNIKTGARKVMTPRAIGYTAVLVLLLALLGYLFLSRSSVDATVLRAPGTLYQEKPGEVISNLYTLKVINKTNRGMSLEARLLKPEGTLTLVGGELAAPAGSVAQAPLFIDIPRARITDEKTSLVIGIYSKGELLQKVSTAFLGPEKEKPEEEGH